MSRRDDPRASNPGRSRRRSLRVPLDEVPRRVSEPETPPAAAAPKPATVPPPPRPRTAPPPPPPHTRLEELSLEELGAAAEGDVRSTDPGTESAPDDLLGRRADSSVELDTLELESEPTSIALAEEPTRVGVSLGELVDAAGQALDQGDVGSRTQEMPIASSELPTTPGSVPAPRRTSMSSRPAPAMERAADDAPLASVMLGGADEDEIESRATTVGAVPRAPATPSEVADGPSTDKAVAPRSERPPASKASERPSGPISGVVVQSGVIVMQRTIAVGVSAPLHTTTAIERESSPPPPLSSPALSSPALSSPALSSPALSSPVSESSIEVALDASVPEEQAAAAEQEEGAEARPSQPDDRDAEELDLEEVADGRSVRAQPPAAPPPPPAGAPPPPPRDLQRPPPPPKAPAAPAAAPAAPASATSSAPTDPETGKRARKKWWEEFFNDDYFRTVPLPQPKTIVAQSAFIAARLGLPPGASILDVGCGLGLHAVELTRLGYTVVGLDLSLPMLSRAADEAQDQGLKINFLQADMRDMAFEGLFDAVLCWGTTFGYFDDDQNRLVVERLHRALKPGGLLLLDVVNRDYVVRTQPNNVWFQGDGCIVMEETNCNFINSRLTVKRQVMLDDGRQNETVYSIRLYSLHELGQVLHHRGFRVVEVSGREATPGVFFGAESPRLIIVAERRPDAPMSVGRSGESQQLQATRDTGKHDASRPDPAKSDS